MKTVHLEQEGTARINADGSLVLSNHSRSEYFTLTKDEIVQILKELGR